MIGFLRGWILNIVTLVIFIVLLEMLMPSGKIKKFLNLITGFILIIAIITPLLGLYKKGINLKDFENASVSFISKKEIENSSKVLKDEQMKQLTLAYRDRMITNIEDSIKNINSISAVKADVIVNEDYNSNKFGEIKRVYLYINLKEDNKKVKPVSKIERIIVGNSGQKNEKSDEIDIKTRNEIENRLNKLAEIKRDDIVIKLQKS